MLAGSYTWLDRKGLMVSPTHSAFLAVVFTHAEFKCKYFFITIEIVLKCF